MNIILTIDFSPWSAYGGGAQRSTHNLAHALCRRGHAVSVVYTKPPWETVNYPDDLPYEVHWATFFDLRSRRNAPLRPINALSVACVVARLLGRHRHTVVHSTGEEGGMIHALRRRHRFGFVSTPRDSCYPKLLLENARLASWQKAWLALTEGKYLMQGRTARQADMCVPPSAYVADMVQRAFNIEPSQMHVVPNGTPEEFLRYEHDPEAAQKGSLVYFGRFDAVKGVDTLLDALALLGVQPPRTRIIGQGSEKQHIQNKIKVLGLNDFVETRPWMTHDELAQTLTGARMVVLPSRRENFSLAILGAMAVGAPVISTRVGGTPEIIEHEKTGLLVAPDQPPALARAIARLLYDPALACRLGQQGCAQVRTHLTWDRAAEAFEALYRTLPALAEARPTHTFGRDAPVPADAFV